MKLGEHVETQLFTALLAVARHHGFDFCAYTVTPLAAERTVAVTMNDNFPTAWRQLYRSKHYAAIDPILNAASQCPSPVLWEKSTFVNALAMWRDAQACGLRHGWSVAAQGRGYGVVVSFVRQHRAITQREFQRLNLDARLLVELAHMAMLAALSLGDEDASPQAKSPPALSRREIEVLGWEAEGKSRREIALLLGLAERTVRQYAVKAYAKLDANNSAKAVMQAVRYGILKV